MWAPTQALRWQIHSRSPWPTKRHGRFVPLNNAREASRRGSGTHCCFLEALFWELGAGSWELGAGSWELGAGSWELGAGSWELGAGSWELGAGRIMNM
ncbi:MAG: hypothetical protein EOR16_31850 [Mesorhizobium sp.]|nr:MAG: hypothetical protein EOR16_31850 [Mesorhizobium sp.]